jgi:hypothetical protein
VAGAGDAAEVANYQRGLLIPRGCLRDELDVKRDDEDLAARAQRPMRRWRRSGRLVLRPRR